MGTNIINLVLCMLNLKTGDKYTMLFKMMFDISKRVNLVPLLAAMIKVWHYLDLRIKMRTLDDYNAL